MRGSETQKNAVGRDLPRRPDHAYKKTAKQAKTYSPAKQIAVPSALEGLTSGFGMGPGGPPPLFSPASTALSKLTKRFPLLRFPLQPRPFRLRISFRTLSTARI